jgi:tetratricopeptide (TPR) repeat protein
MRVGSARLDLHARTCDREDGDLLAEREVAHFLPVQVFPLSTAHPLASKSLPDLSSLANLASALTGRFEQLGVVDHLTEAIKLHRRALQLSPSDRPLREARLSSLAIALRTSFERQGNLDTLAEAVQLHHEALRRRSIGHPFRAQSLFALEVCLLIKGADLFDFDRGITLMSEALSDNAASIRRRLRIALFGLRAVERVQQGEAENNEKSTLPETSTRIIGSYQQAIQLLRIPGAAHFGIGQHTRFQMAIGSAEMSRNGAARFLLLGRVFQAVEILEDGRVIFWSQTLHLRASELDNVPDAESQRISRRSDAHSGRRAGAGLGQSTTAHNRERKSELRRQLNMQAEVLIAKIRAFPGHECCLIPKAFDLLVTSLPLGFIVIVNTSELAFHAIILSLTLGIAHVLKLQAPCGGFRFEDIWMMQPRNMTMLEASIDSTDETREMGFAGETSPDSLHTTLYLGAENAVQPILEYAADISRLTLILRPVRKRTSTAFLESPAIKLETLVRGCENEPYSLGLNLPVEVIILTIPRRRLVVLTELDTEQREQRNFLADLLGRQWNGNGECSLVVQDKKIGFRRGICREILQAHRACDAKLVVTSGALATSLHAPYPSTRNPSVLVEVLDFDKEAPRLRPEGHPERSLSCGKLANSLWTRFNQTGDMLLLDQALELCREALRLRPEGHPHRASSCGMLAGLLMTRFNQTGNTVLLEEALELERETLRSRPKGHLLRASSCGNLAYSLRAQFNQTGDTVLLDEALDLEREALHLRPKGHPERARSCTSLANSLITLFNQIGDTVILDEALELNREALRLRPMEHSHRALSCGNLASSLWARFQQTGDTVLLHEAVELEREALHLRPEGHPHRAHSCGNLADSLRACFTQTRDTSFLDEALDLEREALRLRLEGHPHRALSCENLADSLKARFGQTGDMVLLDEALELNKEALRLRPMGHPYHALSCGNLADSLRSRFSQTGETALLDEARLVCSRAIKCSEMSPSDNVFLRIQMIHILVLPSTLSYSPSTAVLFLLEAIQHRAGLIPHFYSICDALRLCVRVAVSDEDNVRLLAVYQALIEILPELGTVVLDKVSRLHRWSDAGSLPLEALLHALKMNDITLGLELLEQGRAVLWSQALAMQGLELQGLTNARKTQLQMLLQSMNSSAEHGDIKEVNSTGRDRAYASYTRLQRLLQEIRASPGLERFMRGPSYPELIQVASAHPVVILTTKDTVCRAVIISSTSARPECLTLDSIVASDLENFGHQIRGLNSNVGARPVTTGMRWAYISRRRDDPTERKLHQALTRLWLGIVKPILDRLGLKVRGLNTGQFK